MVSGKVESIALCNGWYDLELMRLVVNQLPLCRFVPFVSVELASST